MHGHCIGQKALVTNSVMWYLGERPLTNDGGLTLIMARMVPIYSISSMSDRDARMWRVSMDDRTPPAGLSELIDSFLFYNRDRICCESI